MKQLNFSEKQAAFRKWVAEKNENVILFTVGSRGNYILNATVENNEETGELRVLSYGWELEDCDFDTLMEHSIFDVIDDMASKRAGGICFLETNEIEERDCDNVFEYLRICEISANTDEPIVIETTTEEFSNMFDVLRPATYIVCFNDEVAKKEEDYPVDLDSVSEEQFKNFHVGSVFYGYLNGSYELQTATSDAFYNYDADEPGWEIESSNGVWSINSVAVSAKGHRFKVEVYIGDNLCFEKYAKGDTEYLRIKEEMPGNIFRYMALHQIDYANVEVKVEIQKAFANDFVYYDMDEFEVELPEEKKIKTAEALYQAIKEEYDANEVELSGTYFVIPIPKGLTGNDLLKVYADMQEYANGDAVVRVEDILIEDNTVNYGKLLQLSDTSLEKTVEDYATMDIFLCALSGTGVYRIMDIVENEDGTISGGEVLDFVF